MKKTKKTDAPQEQTTGALAPVLTVACGDLVPRYADAASNPNRMEAEKYAMLLAAIRDEGFLQPILVTRLPNGKYRIEDGHHRWWAARELGLTEVSVCVKEYAGAKENPRATLLGIGMNKLRGELDLSTTVDVIREVQDILDGIELPEISALTGFTTEELELLLEDPTDPAGLLDDSGSAIDEVEREERKDSDKVYTLELKFTDKDQFKLVKRKLRKLGSGDLAHGVVVALGEDD